ncbi:conserved hypothetical protein [Sulfurovum sp. enrichment culture clone C5]|uniref:Uncharacterized protein n=1 Tax=Sulfurovum sp. enrichment culture clone C5 TaxID=497650 RepID=A0A0S4XN57_9BACT|nr:conserved hypothetical protein [Sulfurovum sp. enrichment culture clone C5]
MKQYDEKDIEEILQNYSAEVFKVLEYKNESMYVPIIEKTCIKEKCDYFDLAYQALNKNLSNTWTIGNILINLIPYSIIDIDNILKFYKLFHSKENGTSKHFQITKLLVLNNHTLANKLLENLIKIDDDFVIPHISAILVELHNSNHESQYNTIVNYLKNDNILQLQCAISYIHLFNFSDEELKEIFVIFKEKVKLSNEKIDRALLYSSYDLIEKGYGYFSKILLLYIDNDDIEIKFHLSQILNFTRKNHIKKKWFRKSFLSIIDVDIENQNVIFHIESVLKEFLKIDDYDFIKEFLYKWIEKGNLSSISSKNTLSTFKHEFNEHKLFSKFVTESLLHENNNLHKVLADLIEKDIELDADTMQAWNKNDYLYVCRKILGYFYEFKIMNTLVFSMLSVDNISDEVKNIIFEVLVNHIGKDYSYDTLEYYKNLEYLELNENEKQAKDIVIEELEKRNQQVRELSILKELTPLSLQNRIISRTNSIAMNKAMKESRKEDSFFSVFFPNRIIILYGRGSFSELAGNFSDVTYLQSISHSVTMPNATRTHPVDYELERYKFRMAKKGQ